jgi:hypothetical protein
MSTIQSKLAKLDKSWDDTKDEFGDSTGGFSTVPSANYVVAKVKASLGESGSGGLMVKRNALIKEGDLEGETIYDNMNIETDRGPEFLLKWLNLMGVQVDSLKKDLEKALEKISANEEATFQISCKEKDGYNNMYFNKCIEEGDIDDEGSGSEKTEDTPDLDNMSKRQLKKYIKENKLDVDPDDIDDDDELRDAIEAALKEKPKEEKSTSRRASRKTESKKDDKKILKGLYNLCDAFGIKCNEDDDLNEFKKTLDGYTFKDKDLDESEKEMLEAAGLGKIIK